MKKTLSIGLILFNFIYHAGAANYTVTTPTDLIEKITTLVAGDTLFVASGTYTFIEDANNSASFDLYDSGTANAKICVFAQDMANRPVLDFNASATGTQGIGLSGAYWHIKGLKITKAGDNGLRLNGDECSNNIIEFCEFYENEDTGLQIDNGALNNTIKNCDSYFNADALVENADGFACKLNAGTGNVFEGCRAWQNLDDGWDGYLKETDNITTSYINCWAFKNGTLKNGNPSGGDGNGFKSGGSDNKLLKHNGIYKNCISAYNPVKGFDHNSNRGDVTLHNCLSTANGTNLGFGSGNPLGSLTIKNTVVIGTLGNVNAGTLDVTNNSWNLSVTADANDFNSILLASMSDARTADGSLPSSVFKLLAGSDLIDKGVDVGLPFSGTAPDLGPSEYVITSSVNNALLNNLNIIQNNKQLVVNGAPVKSIKIINLQANTITNSQNKQIISLEYLEPGIYICLVETEYGSVNKKIIIE